MSLDIDVYNALDAQGISPLIRGWLPETQALPCAVVRYITNTPIISLKQELSKTRQLIAIDCWGGSLESAEAMRDSVLAAVPNTSLVAVPIVIRPRHEPEIKTFRFIVEYSIWG